MGSVDEQVHELTASALPELGEVYVDALIAQAEGDPGAASIWAEFRRMMFRILMFSDLLGRADAVAESRGAGMAIGAAEEDLSDLGLDRFDDASPLITAPFLEAIDLFQGRIPRLRETIEQITPGIREAAFWVTGIEETSALEKIQAMILRSLDPTQTLERIEAGEPSGQGISDFAATIRDDLGEALTTARLETVYRTNVVQALSDGRDAQLRDPGIKNATALWMLNEVQDTRTRGNPAGLYPDAGPHFQMDGFIEDPGHSVWRQIGWPGPGGFQCRRSVSPIGWPTAIRNGWANEDRTLNKSAIDAHNGRRWDFINSGQYPDDGFGG